MHCAVLLLALAQIPETGTNLAQTLNQYAEYDTYQVNSSERDFSGALPGKPGTNVKGKESAFFRTQLYLEPSQQGEKKEAFFDICLNACQGPPPDHATHEECDRLCDMPCESYHEGSIARNEGFTLDGDAYFAAMRAGNRMLEAARRRGYNIEARPDTAVTEAVNELLGLTGENGQTFLNVSIKHPIRDPYEPCTACRIYYYYRLYNVMMLVEVSQVVSVPQPPTPGSSVRTSEIHSANLDHQHVKLGSVYLLDENPEFQKTEACACKRAQKPERQVGFIPSTWDGTRTRTIPTSTAMMDYGQLVAFHSMKPVQFTIHGQDMNTCVASLEGPPGSTGFLPAGTRLVPSRDDMQEMLLEEDVELVAEVVASVGGRSNAKKIRVMCAQMEKETPTPAVQYQVAAPLSPALARMARDVARSPIKGPWDQARTWLATDRADYATLAKRLIPPPTPGRFRELAFEVRRSGARREVQAHVARVVTAPMLFEFGTNEEALRWGIASVLKREPGALLKAAPAAPMPMLVEKRPGAPRFVAMLARVLMANPADESRKAALMLLKAGVPEADRAALLREGALSSLPFWLGSSKESQALDALQVFALYRPAPCEEVVKGLAERSPFESVRKAAAAALGR
ncbi:MAG TPA: hypothetical protein VM328_06680 [Fimbriimonadaceae bacterium]|nr:hypothetical protein [Fimbriimonadaceae bacterium]